MAWTQYRWETHQCSRSCSPSQQRRTMCQQGKGRRSWPYHVTGTAQEGRAGKGQGQTRRSSRRCTSLGEKKSSENNPTSSHLAFLSSYFPTLSAENNWLTLVCFLACILSSYFPTSLVENSPPLFHLASLSSHFPTSFIENSLSPGAEHPPTPPVCDSFQASLWPWPWGTVNKNLKNFHKTLRTLMKHYSRLPRGEHLVLGCQQCQRGPG